MHVIYALVVGDIQLVLEPHRRSEQNLTGLFKDQSIMSLGGLVPDTTNFVYSAPLNTIDLSMFEYYDADFLKDAFNCRHMNNTRPGIFQYKWDCLALDTPKTLEEFWKYRVKNFVQYVFWNDTIYKQATYKPNEYPVDIDPEWATHLQELVTEIGDAEVSIHELFI